MSSDSPQSSTTLFDQLAARIRLEGAITVADYMSEVLTAPRGKSGAGYYMEGNPFGAEGDFITAPEISQMFGEMLGLWLADTWANMGAPEKVILAEPGPGRGTLMADALRAARMVPDFIRAIEIHLVEVSPALREIQSEALSGFDITWHNAITELPEGKPLLLVANEFFDALPIHQFEKSPQGWCERLITLNENADELVFALGKPSPLIERGLPDSLRNSAEGTVFEHCPAGVLLTGEIARRIKQDGGAALIIDYGRDRFEPTPTLQAIRAHQFHPVLEAPGTADLSALVDFPALIGAAEQSGVLAQGPVGQGTFLKGLGLEQRAEMLRTGATPGQRESIDQALERLTSPEQMGTLFKAIALHHPEQPGPAGFPDRQSS